MQVVLVKPNACVSDPRCAKSHYINLHLLTRNYRKAPPRCDVRCVSSEIGSDAAHI